MGPVTPVSGGSPARWTAIHGSGAQFLLLYPSLIEDTNGNEISVATATENGIPDVVTSWTDSMGRSIPSPAASDLTSCPTTPILPTTAWIWALAHAPNG